MDSQFEKEARELLDALLEDDMMVGYNVRDVARAAEAMRAVAERAWEDGYWDAEQDQFKHLTENPYAKPTEGDK